MTTEEDGKVFRGIAALELRAAKIERLLHARFPGSWAPRPLTPVGSREQTHIGADFRAQVAKARKALQATTDQELDSMHAVAVAAQRKRDDLKASLDEEGRFFNLASAAADFSYWAKAEYWTFEEALALVHGKSPEVVTWKAVEPFIGISAFAKRFAETRTLAIRAARMGRGSGSVWPTVALEWAKRQGIDVPQGLVAAVEAHALETPAETAMPILASPSLAGTGTQRESLEARQLRRLERLRALEGVVERTPGAAWVQSKTGRRGALADLVKEEKSAKHPRNDKKDVTDDISAAAERGYQQGLWNERGELGGRRGS